MLKQFIDVLLHLDKYLVAISAEYGVWIYAILFLIIFCETGLVVTPFLPGDSLLFAVGALASTGAVDLWLIVLLLCVAAILGDSVNYFIGHKFGDYLVAHQSKIIKKEYLDKTHDFYERYGGRTIVIARFVPIVRTFAPFVAGMGSMTYSHFITYNIVGGLMWIFSLSFLGFFFGELPIVKKNFSLVIFGIILISILPIVWEVMKAKFFPERSTNL
ncbi:MAG: DedA family protein [Chlorobiales bacterium]